MRGAEPFDAATRLGVALPVLLLLGLVVLLPALDKLGRAPPARR